MSITRTISFAMPPTMEQLLIALQRLNIPSQAVVSFPAAGVLTYTWEETI